MKIIAVAISLTVFLSVNCFSKELSKDDKQYFIQSEMPSCLETQKSYRNKSNVEASDLQLYKYCKCFLSELANKSTLEDILQSSRSKSVEHMRPLIDSSAAKCMKSNR